MIHVWYIYLQNWAIFGGNVGKYSSTMEHTGYIILIFWKIHKMCSKHSQHVVNRTIISDIQFFRTRGVGSTQAEAEHRKVFRPVTSWVENPIKCTLW